MIRQVKKFSNGTYEDSAVTEDGKVWRWLESTRIIPLAAAREYGVPVDEAAQQKALDIEFKVIGQFLKARARKGR
jgi:hypothetical protein